MSRQFNEYMEGRFDLYGEEYELVEPDSVEELESAVKVKNALETYVSALMHDDDSREAYESLLQQQIDYINGYAESIGEFNNTVLANNIAYLTKKTGLRIGELEDMLDISAGYISRTMKEASKRKISIDIVWKIAQIFNVDIKALTETDLWVPRHNVDLLVRFMRRLTEDTNAGYFGWEYGGGYMVMLEDRFKEMGFITEEDDEDQTAVYHPVEHLNPAIKWILPKDIMYIECFEKKKDLVIIPYRNAEKAGMNGFDFIFAWEDEGEWKWEKFFYTSDDPYFTLREEAEKLFEAIENNADDVRLSSGLQKMITNYVNAGRP